MNDMRLNPDELLRVLKKETEVSSRGHLKIFFGYAAGVGKTYSMLKAAHYAKKRGVDVVVGYIEPHSRPQTAQLLNGLEVIPTIGVNHNNITLKEFDLDSAIKRKPRLILVDELAHSNAENSRHTKRYQDVNELLSAGIDVYTTVNVQHIESLNDIVASITGIMVRERIPDHIFDNADQVELVDIEPEELIERLKTGKIYKENQAQKALGNFFSVENLIALREIALRRCADRVNKISDNARIKSNNDYYTEEHILVCLSTSPSSSKIIRTASRMANAFKGAFTALFVETPDFQIMEEKDKNRLRSNIRLAQQLGATIETVYGDDIAFQIAEFARISGVSKIVVGRTNATRKYFWSKPTLIEKLTSYSPNLDIYIIPDKKTTPYKSPRAKQNYTTDMAFDTLISSIIFIISTLIGFLFYYLNFSEANIITIYILEVLVTAVLTKQRIYSLVASVVSVFTFNFLFTEPRFTLTAGDAGYYVTFIIMLISAFITSTLAVKIKQHAKQAAETTYRTKILLETNQLLQQTIEKSDIISVTARQLTKLLNRDIVFYLPEKNGYLAEPSVFSLQTEELTPDYTTDNEKAVANWVFKNNKHAGASTNTLCNAKCLYLAIRINSKVYGIVGIGLTNNIPLDAFENSIVLSILGECALAMENSQVAKEREEAKVIAKNEQLRANLLRSISHDLRTPLTAISGNAGILLSNAQTLDNSKKHQIYSDIYDDSLWLINLVENLLSVTRIEDGTMNLKFSSELIDEVINEAMQHINRRSKAHKIIIKQEQDLILAKMDARLIVQVVINIVDNAIKYTPAGSEITINTKIENKNVVVEISDNGVGIPDKIKPKVFDMFYTANNKIGDSHRSLGLGLSLCKSIISAHGGDISVNDNKPTGAIFKFTLPAEEVILYE